MSRIFLIGYMGAGKTTLGKVLASKLDLSFVDLDAFIEQRHFKTIAQIFDENGEEGFRQIEREALLEASAFEDVIISTGGGAPCFFDNMEIMNAKGLTVYLHLPPEELLENLKKGKSRRPLIRNKSDIDLLCFIEENLMKRNSFYNQAKLVINPCDDVEEIATRISSLI